MEEFSCCSAWDECCIVGKCVNKDEEFINACGMGKKLAQGINTLYKGSLILIDGNSLLHRSYHAYPFMSSPAGVPTHAVYGTLKYLERILKRVAPTHLLFCFDASKKTFRNDLYPDYKANRKDAPEDLVPQFALIRTVLKRFNIPYLEDENVEADDLIGTIANNAGGYMTKIVSSDKDMLQLVNHRVSVLLVKNGGEYLEITTDNILEKMGYKPWDVPELKALSGDKSDNIPGVPGVGDMTALKLLKEHGSLEKILENVPDIPGKLGEKIAAAVEDIRLFRTLATIKTDCDLSGFDKERLKLNLDVVAGEIDLQRLGIRTIHLSQSKKKDWYETADNVSVEDIGDLFDKKPNPVKELEKAVEQNKYEQPSLF